MFLLLKLSRRAARRSEVSSSESCSDTDRTACLLMLEITDTECIQIWNDPHFCVKSAGLWKWEWINKHILFFTLKNLILWMKHSINSSGQQSQPIWVSARITWLSWYLLTHPTAKSHTGPCYLSCFCLVTLVLQSISTLFMLCDLVSCQISLMCGLVFMGVLLLLSSLLASHVCTQEGGEAQNRNTQLNINDHRQNNNLLCVFKPEEE